MCEDDAAGLEAYVASAEGDPDAARIAFLRVHAEAVYEALTDGLRLPLRDEALVYAAADRFPGLTPTREQMAAERGRPLPEKQGSRSRRASSLVRPRLAALRLAPGWAMLRPTDEALARIDEFRATGVADLGGTDLERAAVPLTSRSATTGT